MGQAHYGNVTSATEIAADFKPLMPWWQRILGLMFFGAAVAGFSVIPDSVRSVAFSILLLAGVATVLAHLLRNKTIPVTLIPTDDCVLIRDPESARSWEVGSTKSRAGRRPQNLS